MPPWFQIGSGCCEKPGAATARVRAQTAPGRGRFCRKIRRMSEMKLIWLPWKSWPEKSTGGLCFGSRSRFRFVVRAPLGNHHFPSSRNRMELCTGEEAVPHRLPGLPFLFLRTKKVGENIFEVRFAKHHLSPPLGQFGRSCALPVARSSSSTCALCGPAQIGVENVMRHGCRLGCNRRHPQFRTA